MMKEQNNIQFTKYEQVTDNCVTVFWKTNYEIHESVWRKASNCKFYSFRLFVRLTLVKITFIPISSVVLKIVIKEKINWSWWFVICSNMRTMKEILSWPHSIIHGSTFQSNVGLSYSFEIQSK